MIERRLSREVAMQLLFQWEAQGLLERKNIASPPIFQNIEFETILGKFLDSFYLKDQSKLDTKIIKIWTVGTLEHILVIDSLIDEASTKWRISRLDAIDRAILRLATFELALEKKLSARIIINEAVEMAKRYGSSQSAAFINGVLDAIHTKSSKVKYAT